MIKTKQALLLLALATVMAATSAEARVYHESELVRLADQPIPADSELVGTFIFLGERAGQQVFSTFTQNVTTPGEVKFGNILISVSFPGGVPVNLSIGKIIKPDSKDPLVIKLVKRSSDGAYLYIHAEYSEKI